MKHLIWSQKECFLSGSSSLKEKWNLFLFTLIQSKANHFFPSPSCLNKTWHSHMKNHMKHSQPAVAEAPPLVPSWQEWTWSVLVPIPMSGAVPNAPCLDLDGILIFNSRTKVCMMSAILRVPGMRQWGGNRSVGTTCKKVSFQMCHRSRQNWSAA